MTVFAGGLIAVAGSAKWGYLIDSIPKVARIVADNPLPEQRTIELARQGGISKGGAIVGGAVLATMLAFALRDLFAW